MFDFGEELTLESSRIPWLIWIQLIVFLLLLLLLFCFILIAFEDPSHDSPTATVTATATASPADIHHSVSTTVINRLHNTRGGENLSIKGEIAASASASASTRIVREEIAEREGSSLYFLHPCYYFRLARVAFLKCLGLDSTSESDGPSTQKHRKRKES